MTDQQTANLPIPALPALSAPQQAHVVNLVRRAAKAEIMPRFRNLSSGEIRTKSAPDDLVTDADAGAEAMIRRGLAVAFPDALIVGEEAAEDDPDLRAGLSGAKLAFLVDPVDGTWNYARGLTTFGVMIAATRFGKPVFGLLYDPVMDDWIVADDEHPAVMRRGRDRARGSARRVGVSQPASDAPLGGYVPLARLPEDKRAQMAATFPAFDRAMNLRAACHEYRMVAQGHADFCLSGSLKPWDHAAGVLICQQAGGHVAMLDGRDYSADLTDGFLLAAADKATWTRLRNTFAFLLN